MVPQKPQPEITNRLLDGLKNIPLDWPLVPLNGNKQPLGYGWQNRPFSPSQMSAGLQNGGITVGDKEGKPYKVNPSGYGLLTGCAVAVKGEMFYLMAVDQDGASALDKIHELSGGEPLPKTVAFTSGRPGRCQYLFLIPEKYAVSLRTKKFLTGVIGDDGKGELLELRWEKLQSCLPPSVHPTTGQYYWVEGCAIWECEIAIAPQWIIKQMLVDTKESSHPSPLLIFAPPTPSTNQSRWTNTDYALSYLAALSYSRAEYYEDWLKVGMALHSLGDDSLLNEWDNWSRQSSKYKPGECQKKWQSFKRTGVSVGTLAHMAIQDGWHSPFESQSRYAQYAAASKAIATNTTATGNITAAGNTTAEISATDNLATDNLANNQSLRSLILEILERNPSPSELSEAFVHLASNHRRSLREIRQLSEELEADLDLIDSRRDRLQEIEQLENYKNRSLNLAKYLPAAYAHPISQIAASMEAPNAAFLTCLLPAVASCLHPATRIIVKESIGFVEPAIIYAGLVTESGQRKSPILNSILDPLKELQAEEDQRYRTDKAEYDDEYKQWQEQKNSYSSEAEWKDLEPSPPKPLREFYLDKTTIEAIDKIKGAQPDVAVLWTKDELSALFGSYGAYKGGRGEDREAVLSGWNGRGVKKNLKSGERVSLLRDSMSILGAIQDTKLEKLMGKFDDEQGEWGRFLWALIPLKALRLPETDSSFYLAFLKDLYSKARELRPQNYRFAFDAQKLFDDYHWQLEQRRVAHPQRGIRAAIAKMEGYTARLALVLHLIWELEAGKTQPNLYIPKERVQAAIALAEFYLSQVNLIHSEGAAAMGEGGLTPRLSAILNKLQQFGELTARKLQASISWLRKVKPDRLRNDLIELAQLGYGYLVGKGNKLKLVLSADSADQTVDKTADSTNNPETLDIRAVETSIIFSADSADIPDITPEAGNEIVNHQQHQHINSLDSTPKDIGILAADNLSTDVSTVSTSTPCYNEGTRVVVPSCPDLGVGVVERFDADFGEYNIWFDTFASWFKETDFQPADVAERTLEELRAMLLACNSLTALNQLKRTHHIGKAYGALSGEEQAHIDGIAALAVPYPVYKYVGDTVEQDTQRLNQGALVYIDPNAVVKSSTTSVAIWLLNSTSQGWKQPIEVSKLLLKEVQKAAPEAGGEQMA